MYLSDQGCHGQKRWAVLGLQGGEQRGLTCSCLRSLVASALRVPTSASSTFPACSSSFTRSACSNTDAFGRCCTCLRPNLRHIECQLAQSHCHIGGWLR